jgi:PAS domain S-box-containing protein
MEKADPRALELLNEVMRAHGWDRAQLADHVGKSKRTIDGIMRGELAMAQDLEKFLHNLLLQGGAASVVRESAPHYGSLKKVIYIKEAGSPEQIALLDRFLDTLEAQLPIATSAIVTTDADGLVTEINPAFSEMCGYTLAELRGKKPGEVLQGAETEQDVVAEFRRAIQERRPFQCDITNYMKDGSSYRVHIEMFPIFDGAGRLTNFKAIESKL